MIRCLPHSIHALTPVEVEDELEGVKAISGGAGEGVTAATRIYDLGWRSRAGVCGLNVWRLQCPEGKCVLGLPDWMYVDRITLPNKGCDS